MIADIFHPLAGAGYQFWSGIGSDFGEITLLTGLVLLWRHINCEEKGCWRRGHPHPDHGRPVCRRHYHIHEPPKKEPQ